MFEILIVLLAVALFGTVFFKLRRDASSGPGNQKQEALFASMFPDLQPHFHPRKVYDFVAGRRARLTPNVSFKWKNPPGFGVDAADVQVADGRERVQLLDAAGTPLGEFIFEENPEGGVLRMGKGKFTANIREAEPRVRYWHPDREFKWTPRSWKFVTRMAEQPMDSSDRGTSFSSDSPSSSSIATGAAVATGIAAAGGAFDGGGASQAWADDGRGSGGGGGDESAPAASTSY